MFLEGTSEINQEVSQGAATPSNTTITHRIRNKSTTPGDTVCLGGQTGEGADSVRGKITFGLSGAGGTRGYVALSTRNSAGTMAEAFRADDNQKIVVTHGLTSRDTVDGIGYSTGAGGAVTQATSKATGVALNRASGQITLNAANLAADTTVSFTFTNTAIAATDVLLMNHISGGTAGSYLLNAQCAAGSALINVRNITAGALAEAIVIQYVVFKGVIA